MFSTIVNIIRYTFLILFFITFYIDYWALDKDVLQFITRTDTPIIDSILINSIYFSYIFYRLGFLSLVIILMHKNFFKNKLLLTYIAIFIIIGIFYNYRVIFQLLPKSCCI